MTPDPDNAIRIMLNGRANLYPASCAALAAPAAVTTPTEDVVRAAQIIVDAWDADTLPVCEPDPMLPAFIAALRALAKRTEDQTNG